MAGRRARRIGGSARTSRSNRPARLGRLSGIGPQQTVLKRRTVKAPDDRVHFIGIWRFDECESFRLLRFRIANYLNRVRDQTLGA
jgi:hypothetical protein